MRELFIETGMEVLATLLEEDRELLCGAKYKHQVDRQANRHGHDSSDLVLGGRKISVRKPRLRSVSDEEIQLPSWNRLSEEDLTGSHGFWSRC